MKRIGLLVLCLSCAGATSAQNVASPSGNLSLSFKLNQSGEAVYQLSYKGRGVVAESKLGFAIRNQPALTQGFAIIDSKAAEVNETWQPVWGEVAQIHNHYRELLVTLRQTAAFPPASNSTTTDLFSSASDGLGKAGELTRTVAVRFRLFDDGLGFRYEFPKQNELKYFTVDEERTEFNLTGNHKAFWIPGDYDTNEYALVEGWNVGWEDWFGNWKEEVFDFVTAYPDFAVTELQEYAALKKVKLIMHHETSGSASNYERRLDAAFRFMKSHGYDAVKTGYVGRIVPRGEHHDGQAMVNHYIHVARTAASYRIMVDAHEPVRPTGLHRTYPNWLACEAARGNEFNAWSVGNPPEHETILPFTRLMGGPMDYTPGIFEIKMSHYQADKREQVHTTLAKQLALYVTMYSPLQMAADLPENYEKRMDAFQFIRDVAVDWDDTRILEAEPGDYLTIARKAKHGDEWYIGAITDENARTATILLDYLPPTGPYVAKIYADAPSAHWKDNPMAYEIKSYLVNSRTELKVALASGGGAAISVRPASADEALKTKSY